MPVQTRRQSRLPVREDIQESTCAEKVSENVAESEESCEFEELVSRAYDFISSKLTARKKHVLEDLDKTENCHTSLVLSENVISLPSEFLKPEKDPDELASELQPGLETTNLYFNFNDPSAVTGTTPSTSQAGLDKLMKKSVITADFEKQHTVPPMFVSKSMKNKQRKQSSEQSAGSKWFHLPATKITPELKQELKLLKMRNILDPKRHYKKSDSKELPKYFQMGTVVEGAADYYSSRIAKKERKKNLVEELLADTQFRRYNKKKFLEIQAAKQSGRKGFYRKKVNRRKPAWARK